MKHEFPYLIRFASIRFQKVFKRILWNRKLTAGGKIFAFSLLTVPPQSAVRLKKLAKKLNSEPAVISRWRKQVELNNCMPRTIDKVVDNPYMAKKLDVHVYK